MKEELFPLSRRPRAGALGLEGEREPRDRLSWKMSCEGQIGPCSITRSKEEILGYRSNVDIDRRPQSMKEQRPQPGFPA